MIAGVASKDKIKLNIVDLIICLGRESFEDDLVFFFTDLKFHSIEDRSEASVGHETALALVLVLEEGLNQETLVSYDPSKALHAGVKDLILIGVQQIFGVKDRRSVELNCLS